jgi:hypothetical protein
LGIINSLRRYGRYEYDGDRFRFFLGDIKKWEEDEQGFRGGRSLSFDLDFYDHVGTFDERVYGEHWERDSRWYLEHHVSAVIWKWCISLTLRGKRIDSTWDALPEEEESDT